MTLKNIAITGHTSGIGKNIVDNISANFLCFSRTNGYNINSKNDRMKIIDESKLCDVFINNAKGDDLAQSHLLMEIFEEWKDEEKLIINIGSRSGLASEYMFRPSLYSIEKSALHITSRQLQNCQRKCRISNIIFGMIDTPANQNNPLNNCMLPTSFAFKTVNYILSVNAQIMNIEIYPDNFSEK